MTRQLSCVLACVLVGMWNVSCAIAADGKRLNADNLMEFHGEGGVVEPVRTAADWARRRSEIVSGMQAVMGPFPGDDRRGPVEMKVLEDVDAGSFRRLLVGYRVDADMLTPAYLCIPKDVMAGKRKAAAVLCLHPTDNRVGHKVVLGLGGRAGRAYGKELAERGYVTLSPAYPHLANYWPNLGGQGYVSGTMKAIWDCRPVADGGHSKGMPVFGALFFVSFMMLGAMVILNLFIGVIMNGMEEADNELAREQAAAAEARGGPNTEERLAQLAGQLEEIGKEISQLASSGGPQPAD